MAGFANLRGIENHCRAGILATRELGELLGNREMVESNPHDTRLDNVLINTDERRVHFICRSREAEKTNEINITSLNNMNLMNMARLLEKVNQRPERTRESPYWWMTSMFLTCSIPSIFGIVVLFMILNKSVERAPTIDIEMKPRSKYLAKKSKSTNCDDSD